MFSTVVDLLHTCLISLLVKIHSVLMVPLNILISLKLRFTISLLLWIQVMLYFINFICIFLYTPLINPLLLIRDILLRLAL
jgi:hypothetical protein